jgi:hypothetical protein
MQFLLLIYDDEKRWNKVGKPDYGSELDEYRAFSQEFANAIQGGNALQPTTAAKTVRVRNGKPLATDGPFAETKEQLAGYYLAEANDLDEAIGIAAKIPGARCTRSVLLVSRRAGGSLETAESESRSRRSLPKSSPPDYQSR